MRTPSTVQPHRAVYKSTSELGTPQYRTASWVPVVSTIERFHCIRDSQLGSNGVLYREVPLYTGQPAGPNGVLYREVPLYTGQPAGPNGVLYRELLLYTGQPAGPNGVLYREVPLYTGQPAGSQWCPL